MIIGEKGGGGDYIAAKAGYLFYHFCIDQTMYLEKKKNLQSGGVQNTTQQK